MSSQQKATRPTGRKHRLPKHLNLDYILIPAPEDLSLLTVTEKSPLPAIIVTPSSPSSTKDFSIAFLATPKKPTLCQRVWSKLRRSERLPDSPEASAHPVSPPITTSSSSWRDTWRGWTGAKPPIALPIASPISENAPGSWHSEHPNTTKNKGRAPRFVFFTSLVFLLVFFHVFTHYVASSDATAFDHGATRASVMSVVDHLEPNYNAHENAVIKSHWASKAHWQGWFGGDHKRAAMKHSGAAFIPVPAGPVVGRVGPVGHHSQVRRALTARNEV